jgi:hypothetical protein
MGLPYITRPMWAAKASWREKTGNPIGAGVSVHKELGSGPRLPVLTLSGGWVGGGGAH